ncbi:hypothetical protein PhCBS80983_g00610 [Powellomyces hirtus]|uniref:HECT-type E3 ubiquitin transferase n=1 Tax=Powellomyces hirtus TaxID=109895 RepID=A0A507EFQ0_9FUNG|nr:hypothetical protein PhCBS80983_g00610 [Powellomyces hirtus]
MDDTSQQDSTHCTESDAPHTQPAKPITSTEPAKTGRSTTSRKRARGSTSPGVSEPPRTRSKEPPGKRQRQAAVKASEGIANIANIGRRPSRTTTTQQKTVAKPVTRASVAENKLSSMGRDKSKGKGKARDDHMDVDTGNNDTNQTSRGQRKKAGAAGSNQVSNEKPKTRRSSRKQDTSTTAAASATQSSQEPAKAAEGTASNTILGRSKRGRLQRQQPPVADSHPDASSSDSAPPEVSDDADHSDSDIHDDDEDEEDDGDMRGTMDIEKMLMGRGGGGVPFSFGDILSGGARHGGNVGGRFTEMLRQIKRKEDPTMQMVALQELAEILSMATEDMFIGHSGQRMAGFSTDEFVQALVQILKGPDPGSSEGFNDIPLSMLQEMGMTAAELGYGGVEMMNPELMLLACRCLSNLIEAHPSSTMHVLQHGAVQVLVGKLMEVEYIDLAEQVLSVLDKISLDYPAAIIRANGLLAVLQYIDFFGLHVQRTAVTIAANACQGLNTVSSGARRYEMGKAAASGAAESENDDVFNKVKEVIPTLERLLGYSDTKLVEQTVRALDRIVDWAWKDQPKLESIITPGLLQTIVGAINLNGMSGTSGAGAIPSGFTKLVKLVVNVANGSPKLATSLLVDHGIVDVIKNYLTGGLDIRLLTELEEETDMETISAAVTNVVVSRPPHQVLEVVKLASAILPSLPADGIWQISAPASSSTAPKDKHSTASESKSKSSEEVPRDNTGPLEPMDVSAEEDHSDSPVSASSHSTVGDIALKHSSEAKPEGPSKAERHLELLKAHPEAVRSYSTLLLPIFLEVFGVTVNALLRRTVVECVAKGIWYLDDQDYLTKALAKNRVFGKFVPELLGLRENAFKTLGADKERKEALVLVSAGVQIALVVMDRCGERFKAWFAREGAMEEMTKIVDMKLDEEQPTAPPSSTKTERTPTARMSDLVKDLKRLRDHVAGHIGSSPATASAADSQSQVEHLLRTVEALRRSTQKKSEAAEAAAAAQEGSGSRSMEDLDLHTEPKDQSPTSEAGSSASAAADASMRSLMDKLTRSDDSSSSSLRRASGGVSKVVVLNSASCTEAEVKAWIVDRCRTILDSFPTAVGTGLVLSMLRELGDTLGRDGPESLETLQKVARHFTGTGDADGGIGVTGFEMLESGILHALAEFLATPGVPDLPTRGPDATAARYTTSVSARLKAFLHVFMNGPTTDPRNRPFYVPGAFKRLVQTLQESLSRVERFDVAAGVPSSATARHQSAFSLMYGSAGAVHQRESSNPSLQLTRQLKLKLAAADPDAVPKQYHALLISVHAVATYKALEDYLKSRVVTPLGSEPPRSETKPSTTATDVTPTTTAAVAAGAATSSSSQKEVEMKDADHAHECGAECEHDDDEDEDGDEEEDDEDAMDEDEAAHAHHFEHDDDDEDEDEDDDLDGDVLNVSDLLLNTEEASRNRRRRQSQTGTPPDGATNQPEDPTGPRRDSVIDVRAEGSARPSSAAPSATPTKAQSSSTLTPPASYAAAAASAAQEFDIEFSIGDAPVPTHSTVFASLYRYANKTQRVPDVWGHVFTVTWRKVPKPSDSDKDTNKQKRASSSSVDVGTNGAGRSLVPTPIGVKLPFSTVLPDGISLEHADGQVLNLLRILHGLNTRWAEAYTSEETEPDDRIVEGGSTALALQEGSQPMERVAGTARTHAPVRVEVLPPAAFANTKLTAKLNRQLDEPLIVASDVLPTWCAALAKHFSFLVPFETRLVYLQSTSFGYSRSMGRWQQQQNQNQGGGGNGSGAGGGGGGSGGDGGAQMLGRIQRQKVRIARNRILDSMIRVMELYGSTQALLEVEFFDEVGTGLGPTLEFYSTVCRDVRTRGGIALGNAGKRIKVWRDDDGAVDALQEQNGPLAYLNPTLGFFPAPMAPDHAEREDGKRALSLFQALGTFVAKALLDSRLIDLPFSPIFLEMVVGEEEEQESALELALGPKGRTCAEFHLVRHVDPSLYKALLELKSYTSSSATVRGASIEDLCLDFTLPGYPEIELCPGGKDVAVTASNVRAYVESVVEMTVGTGVAKQIKAFRTGFDAVFPATDLASFSVQELAVLVGGTGDEDDDKEGGGTWSAQSLREAIRTDHGFNAESPTIAHLITYMSQLSGSARRDFLQFVTGSPKLPVGGFKNLNPPLTVVRKHIDVVAAATTTKKAGETGEGTPTLRTANDYLPSVMTCANYLKVPEYRDVETLRARFDLAVKEGQGCFHLS